jgi:hypothetical protein
MRFLHLQWTTHNLYADIIEQLVDAAKGSETASTIASTSSMDTSQLWTMHSPPSMQTIWLLPCHYSSRSDRAGAGDDRYLAFPSAHGAFFLNLLSRSQRSAK